VTPKAAVQTEDVHEWLRAHLINGAVMLREAKHLWLFPVEGIAPENDQRFFASLRMTAMRQWDRNLTRKGRINEAK
jgi:hypothetical protein